MTNWTAGPWELCPYDVETREVQGPKEQHVCFCNNDRKGMADGNLIAAAPELYDALERASTNIDLAHAERVEQAQCHYGIALCDCPLATNWRSCEAALKKARGRA